jgi:hypothetical protein
MDFGSAGKLSPVDEGCTVDCCCDVLLSLELSCEKNPQGVTPVWKRLYFFELCLHAVMCISRNI